MALVTRNKAPAKSLAINADVWNGHIKLTPHQFLWQLPNEKRCLPLAVTFLRRRLEQYIAWNLSRLLL